MFSVVSIPAIYYEYIKAESSDDFFFGVSFGGNTASQAKLLIDKVKDYTNFFLINNWDISLNETALNEISQYAVDADLRIMVYFDFIPYRTYPWLQTYLSTAKEKWGDQFLGVYLFDEPGGKQIDSGQWRSGLSAQKLFENVTDYADAANRFVSNIPSGPSWQFTQDKDIPVFTSDYALYWFDYLAGYDTVFVELGWDHNRTQHIALARGAANVQDKDWGAIIVWKSRNPDDENKGIYKTGEEMFQDMTVAYSAGAKYIVVFDYPYEQTYGILEEEHFEAMETFWNTIHSQEQEIEKVDAEVAFVLPKDYGWGMRHKEDKIWIPAWGPDELSPSIWNKMNELLTNYGLKLDIIYNDERFDFEKKYLELYYWNLGVP